MRAPGEGTVKEREFTRADGSTYTRYYARVSIPGRGKRRRLDGPLRASRRDAARDLPDLRRRAREGTRRRGTTDRTLLADYLASWLATQRHTVKPNTYRGYEQMTRLYLLPELGDIPLVDLTPAVVQDALNHWIDTAPASVPYRARLTLSAALGEAVRLEVLDRNPIPRTTAPTPASRAEVPWTPAHARAFLTAARDDRYYALWYTLVATGLRVGEARALRWEHIDDAPSIRVRHTVIDAAGVTDRMGDPKYPASARVVAITREHAELLGAWRGTLDEAQTASRLVFPSATGRILPHSSLHADHFRPVLERAGVPRITIHDLRHYHLSRCAALGMDLATLARRAGHARKSTTADLYVHAFPGADARGAVPLAALLGVGGIPPENQGGVG